MVVIRQEPSHKSHIKVYALHLKDIRIGIYLMVLYFAQLALQGYVTPNAVMRITYDSICDTREVHQDVMYLGCVVYAVKLGFGSADLRPGYRPG